MIKIAINGFGRIGRPTFKRILEKHPRLNVVAINDLTDNKTLAHLLKYDSLYGIYDKGVKSTEKSLIINGKRIAARAEKDPAKLPWKKMGIDVVLECTGFFTDYEGAKKHLKAGAKKVIISAPSKSPEVKTYILGGNGEKYNSRRDDVVSMASCTTNCLVPVLKVLHKGLGIGRAFMTTIHSYTSTQRVVDGPHKDLRRARAAAVNLIPTTTGATIAATKVLPELEGKINGVAIRVPTPTVSLVDLVACVEKDTTEEEVNYIFREASLKENLKGILGIEDALLVSSDYIGNSYSAIVDANLTMVEDKRLVKVLAWYDNEWGYACRLAEFCEFVGSKL